MGRLRLAAVVAALLAAAGVANAQTATDAPPAASKAKPTGGGGGDGDLRRRVQQLEEQLVDLQVVIGTLELLARSGGASPAPRVVAPVGGGGADPGRIDALETQVRALSSQIEQLQSGRGVAPSYSAAPMSGAAPSTFGSTTVNAGEGDPIGGLIAQDSAVAPAPLPPVNERISPAQPAGPSGIGYGCDRSSSGGRSQAGV